MADQQFLNRYKCPRCLHLWVEVWLHVCASECPECGKCDIEPYESEDAVPESSTPPKPEEDT